MLRYAADENFNNDILSGLRRRDDRLDVVRVQDVELSATLDPDPPGLGRESGAAEADLCRSSR